MDKRSQKRVPFSESITIEDIIAKSRKLSGKAMNISVSGMVFTCEQMLIPGRRVHIWIGVQAPTGSEDIMLEALVYWAKPQETGTIVGVRFFPEPTPEKHRLLCELIKLAHNKNLDTTNNKGSKKIE